MLYRFSLKPHPPFFSFSAATFSPLPPDASGHEVWGEIRQRLFRGKCTERLELSNCTGPHVLVCLLALLSLCIMYGWPLCLSRSADGNSGEDEEGPRGCFPPPWGPKHSLKPGTQQVLNALLSERKNECGERSRGRQQVSAFLFLQLKK